MHGPARTTNAAVAVCLRCPVIDECRGWVLALPNGVDRDGVAAGMDVAERRARRRSVA